jgi:hypothetical protein
MLWPTDKTIQNDSVRVSAGDSFRPGQFGTQPRQAWQSYRSEGLISQGSAEYKTLIFWRNPRPGGTGPECSTDCRHLLKNPLTCLTQASPRERTSQGQAPPKAASDRRYPQDCRPARAGTFLARGHGSSDITRTLTLVARVSPLELAVSQGQGWQHQHSQTLGTIRGCGPYVRTPSILPDDQCLASEWTARDS